MLDSELFSHFGLPPERTRRTLARPGKTVDADDLTRRLCLAVDAGHDSLVRLLLDADADADAPNTRGVTPLYAAARSGRLAIVETLLDAGASADTACTGDGRTPLHGAAHSGEAEVAARLLAADADLSPRSKSNATPLHLACARGRAGVVRLLLSSNAPASGCLDERGCTPLHLAAEAGHLDVARMLLRAGADIDAGAGSELGPPLLLACLTKPRKPKAEVTRHGAPRAAAAHAAVPAAASATAPGPAASGPSGGKRPAAASAAAPRPLRRDGQQRPARMRLDLQGTEDGPGGGDACGGVDASLGMEPSEEMIRLLLSHGADADATVWVGGLEGGGGGGDEGEGGGGRAARGGRGGGGSRGAGGVREGTAGYVGLVEAAHLRGAPPRACALLRSARDESRRQQLLAASTAADRVAASLLAEEALEQRMALGRFIRQRAAAAHAEEAADRQRQRQRDERAQQQHPQQQHAQQHAQSHSQQLSQRHTQPRLSSPGPSSACRDAPWRGVSRSTPRCSGDLPAAMAEAGRLGDGVGSEPDDRESGSGEAGSCEAGCAIPFGEPTEAQIQFREPTRPAGAAFGGWKPVDPALSDPADAEIGFEQLTGAVAPRVSLERVHSSWLPDPSAGMCAGAIEAGRADAGCGREVRGGAWGEGRGVAPGAMPAAAHTPAEVGSRLARLGGGAADPWWEDAMGVEAAPAMSSPPVSPAPHAPPQTLRPEATTCPSSYLAGPFYPAPEDAEYTRTRHTPSSTPQTCNTQHTEAQLDPFQPPHSSQEGYNLLISHAHTLQHRLTAMAHSAAPLRAALDTARADAAQARRQLKIATGDPSLLGSLGLAELERVEAQAVGTLCAVLPLLQRARSEAVRASGQQPPPPAAHPSTNREGETQAAVMSEWDRVDGPAFLQ